MSADKLHELENAFEDKTLKHLRETLSDFEWEPPPEPPERQPPAGFFRLIDSRCDAVGIARGTFVTYDGYTRTLGQFARKPKPRQMWRPGEPPKKSTTKELSADMRTKQIPHGETK